MKMIRLTFVVSMLAVLSGCVAVPVAADPYAGSPGYYARAPVYVAPPVYYGPSFGIGIYGGRGYGGGHGYWRRYGYR